MTEHHARLREDLTIDLGAAGEPIWPPTARLIHWTTSLCRVCKNGLEAAVVAKDDDTVWLHKRCPDHGPQSVQIAADVRWYERTRAVRPVDTPPPERRPAERGCPFDCGPCEQHRQQVRLPVVTITSACNLDCPICYVHNKNEDAYHMGTAEFRQLLEHRTRANGGRPLDLINFTGGEPTEHPNFLEFLEICREAGVHRVAICTNGLKLARDEALVARMAELGGRVALSFDSFDAEVDYQMQGARLYKMKIRCLDLLERYDVDSTLIPVVTRGYNDHELGRIIELALQRPNVRHLEFHTITYTGQGGISFDRSGRISLDEVLGRIEAQSDGLLRASDFVSSPCAHPLCYQIAYLLRDPSGGPYIPFTRFMDRQTFYECLGDHLYLEPSPRLERAMLEGIDRLWIEGGEEAERILQALKALLAELFPRRPLSRAEALAVSERAAKAVYVHSHMDEETFDTERLAQCCDSNCYADGRTVPVCSYNVLYREKEARFMKRPLTWNDRSGGRLRFDVEVWS